MLAANRRRRVSGPKRRLAQPGEHVRIGVGTREAGFGQRQRRVERDGGELTPQQCVFALFAQPHRHLRRAAQAQEGNLVDALQQRIQAAEVRQQHRCRFGADAGHAGDVVDGIAA